MPASNVLTSLAPSRAAGLRARADGIFILAQTASSAQGEGSLVRWDIISFDFSKTPLAGSPGGVAFASFDADHKIKFTGSGSFVAPASGGASSHAQGGGTWETFFPDSVSTGRGTYEV